MLQILLQELKKAITEQNHKRTLAINKQLNNLGMDNYTIQLLLQDIKEV